jgi:hypothetical protein
VTKEVTLRQAGGSVSATLPKDMADRLHLEAGDHHDLETTDEDVVTTMLALADGSLTEPQLADWVRDRLQRQK